MEDDPNKKESKGKRILKKALRRNSKSSNNGQGSGLDQSIGVSRSKSFETAGRTLNINDSAPLPKPDGAAEPTAPPQALARSDPLKEKKVEIHESHNNTIAEATELLPSPKDPRQSTKDGGKRNLKRKLEEESGVAGTSGSSPGAGASESDTDDKDPSKDKKKKNRCAVCRKKVGLTGFECRCGGLFCAVHRYSDKHECSFDYRELGAQEIRRNNPVVVSQKIHKI